MTEGTAQARIVLTQIAPESWEHPADRAALNALRNVPGFDEAVKRILSYFGEHGIRLLFQANAVRCGPKQYARLNGLLAETCATMDWEKQPELYVTQTPVVNAGAVGFKDPFIILNTAAVEMLNDDELRWLIGHELGHVISGHATYRTITILLLVLGFQNLPFLAGLALLPIKLALLEWYRKSELSSDRAGLLAGQDEQTSFRVFMKLAGGSKEERLNRELDLDEFMRQAAEYETSGGPLDAIYKILNTLGMTHPFHTLRAAELKRWIDGGTYQKILGGEYTRRGAEREQRPYGDDVLEAAGYYAREARDVAAGVADAAKRAAQAFAEALKGSRKQ
jgi:Zn-dependent protease with chaperone function